MSRRNAVAAICMGIAVALGVIVGLVALHRPRQPDAAGQAAAIGGPFSLIDQTGRATTERDLLGKPSVIFFGFTYCPEICPTTLANLTAWMTALGPDAAKLNVIFVSIDPERDTPAVLRRYLSSFDRRIRGLTGSAPRIAQIAREFHVYYQRVPLEGGGYTMDHSSAIYLIDAHGRFGGVMTFQTPQKSALVRLRGLIAGR